MYNIPAKNIPYQRWMTEESKKIVDDFNKSGKHLILSFFNEPEGSDELDCMLDEGMYDFIYPDCPEAEQLKAMVDEAAKYPRYLGFDVSDLCI